MFSPKVIDVMGREKMISLLKALLCFDFSIENVVNDTMLGCDLALIHEN